MNAHEKQTGKSRDEIAQAYKSEPWWYDVRGFFILTFAYNSTLWEQLRFFGPNFGARHLEVACGTGTLLELVLRWRAWKKLPTRQIVGVDYAESMLAGAVHRFKGRTDITFQHADAAAMPFETASFDTVNVANAVHCFPDVRGAVADIFRVLKPGGTVAANVLLHPRGFAPLRMIAERINAWGVRKGILVGAYDQDEILGIFRSVGFEIIGSRVSGNCLNIMARRI